MCVYISYFSIHRRGRKAHEENICLFKALRPEAPAFGSSEKKTPFLWRRLQSERKILTYFYVIAELL